MDQRVKQIAYRLTMATPGPWCAEVEPEGSFIAKIGNVYIVPEYQHLAEPECDAELIANAPADLLFLLQEIERLKGVLDEHRMVDRLQTSEFDYD